jgi:DeoR/GlpR family transcriptional regulator of sugar metabolism
MNGASYIRGRQSSETAARDDGDALSPTHSTVRARRAAIADLLATADALTVAELRARFGVSAATARRDLNALARAGLLARSHGGAMSAARQPIATIGILPAVPPTKDEIDAAHAVEREIEDEDTLFLDHSPFAFGVAELLARRRRPLRVITNGLAAASVLWRCDAPGISLVLTGGTLLPRHGAFVGPVTETTIRAHYADRAILAAVHDSDPRIESIRSAMRVNARTTVSCSTPPPLSYSMS